jgi:FkbM family methyltransferase
MGSGSGLNATPPAARQKLNFRDTIYRSASQTNAENIALSNPETMIKEKQTANHAEGDVDKIIRQRFFPQQNFGVFVEVGAANPGYLSISALYRSLGWSVIAIEPNPSFCELHRKRGYDVLEYACGDHDEDGVDFCVVDSHRAGYEMGEISFESFSSLAIKESYAKLSHDLDIRKIKVNMRRLDTILATHAVGVERIDILSVDVEGWELEVLTGLNFNKYNPRVLVIENFFNDRKYRAYMLCRGYSLWAYIPPNDIYVLEPFGLIEQCRSFLDRLGLPGWGRVRDLVAR